MRCYFILIISDVRFHSICWFWGLPCSQASFTRCTDILILWLPQSGDPAKRARAIVQAVTHYNNAKILAEVSPKIVSLYLSVPKLVDRFPQTSVKPWWA